MCFLSALPPLERIRQFPIFSLSPQGQTHAIAEEEAVDRQKESEVVT